MTSRPPGIANTAGSLRQEVAAVSSICQVGPTRCQARTRLYRDGKLEIEGFPVADISDYLADGSVTIWLDLRGPDRDDLAVLSEESGLHTLAVEAALRPSQRHRLIIPMSEVVSELMRRDLHIVGDDLMPYYQDVYDQVLRAAEWTDGLRNLVTSILETNLTIQGNRLNITTKKVTGWTAIIAVPTLITG